jgi:hypothetical protein
MKVITVSKRERPRNGEVLVIRPQSNTREVNVIVNGNSDEQTAALNGDLPTTKPKAELQQFVQGSQQFRLVDASASGDNYKRQPNFIFY